MELQLQNQHIVQATQHGIMKYFIDYLRPCTNGTI